LAAFTGWFMRVQMDSLNVPVYGENAELNHDQRLRHDTNMHTPSLTWPLFGL
jgi:hypothetical protein